VSKRRGYYPEVGNRFRLPRTFWPRNPAARIKADGRKEMSRRACWEWRRRFGTGREPEGFPAFDFLDRFLPGGVVSEPGNARPFVFPGGRWRCTFPCRKRNLCRRSPGCSC